jgi:hypothetical protein
VIAVLSAGTYLPGLILGILIGVGMLRAAMSFQQRWGQTPCGMPPWVWLLFGLILGLIGLILYLIAQATTKRKLSGYPGSAPPYGSAYPPPQAPPYPPPPMPPPDAQGWAPPSQYPSAPASGDTNPPSSPEQATPPPPPQ